MVFLGTAVEREGPEFLTESPILHLSSRGVFLVLWVLSCGFREY